MAPRNKAPGNPRLSFFQIITRADVRKQEASSNDADSGGGARDLRMPRDFWEAMLPFFPEDAGVNRTGEIHSRRGTADPAVATIKLHKPTTTRPNEIRIGKINEIIGWKITLPEFDSIISSEDECLFLLTLDDKGQTWAQIAKLSKIKSPNSNKAFSDFVTSTKLDCEERGIRTVRGVFDFEGTDHFQP